MNHMNGEEVIWIYYPDTKVWYQGKDDTELKQNKATIRGRERNPCVKVKGTLRRKGGELEIENLTVMWDFSTPYYYRVVSRIYNNKEVSDL